jgi:hypothetical protein
MQSIPYTELAYIVTATIFAAVSLYRSLAKSDVPDATAQRLVLASWLTPWVVQIALLISSVRLHVDWRADWEFFSTVWGLGNMLITLALTLVSDATGKGRWRSAAVAWLWAVWLTTARAPLTWAQGVVLSVLGLCIMLYGMRSRWLATLPGARTHCWLRHL